MHHLNQSQSVQSLPQSKQKSDISSRHLNLDRDGEKFLDTQATEIFDVF